jgi:hypothetical protein
LSPLKILGRELLEFSGVEDLVSWLDQND